jgi:glutamate-1-semialdehyde aminotransferase
VTAIGSLLNIHFTAATIHCHRNVCATDRDRGRKPFMGLLNRGIFATERGMLARSTAMGEPENEIFLSAVEGVVA